MEATCSHRAPGAETKRIKIRRVDGPVRCAGRICGLSAVRAWPCCSGSASERLKAGGQNRRPCHLEAKCPRAIHFTPMSRKESAVRA